MAVNIALAGNPNSGKTTMFNDLTGSAQYVGNWPGVTVEKKEGRLKGTEDVFIQDLPGIYSLSPYTPEEMVTRRYLVNDKPDAIINIVDASNIERNLYLTAQLAEIGAPMVIALNMMDVVRKNGDNIDIRKLGEALGCEIVETSALRGEGSALAAEKAAEAAAARRLPAWITFSAEVEKALSQISSMIRDRVDRGILRWYSVKLFERDRELISELSLSYDEMESLEGIISSCEEHFGDDCESIIISQRYDYIGKLVEKCVKIKRKSGLSTSDKIDGIVTNRILALPIFALVMFIVYYLAVSSIGTALSGWVNDGMFGEGFDLFGKWIPGLPVLIENGLNAINCSEALNSLILDGIVAGVGGVLGFLPQMIVLFLCLAILEDCGYMSRVAFIMDRVFRRFGLSGKSFIPILIGTGCGVPGIMASRTIESESDRRMTVITTTFIPCGAKLPVIALIAGALFEGSAWIASSAYLVGIASIIVSGVILKKTRLFAGEPSPFVMELPAYHMPGAKGVFAHTWDRSKSFVKKAGTLILLASMAVWFLSSFNWSLRIAAPDESMLAFIGRVIAPVFAPLGWGSWQAAVATLTGLAAKENIVGTLGVLYGLGETSGNGADNLPRLANAFTQLSAYSFLIFNLLCAPCFAAIGAVKREMMSAAWTWFAVGYQTGFAYAVSLMIYQLGALFTGGTFGIGSAFALMVLAYALRMIFRKPYSGGKRGHNFRAAPRKAYSNAQK